jgi:hypothetical protein
MHYRNKKGATNHGETTRCQKKEKTPQALDTEEKARGESEQN